MLIGLDQESSFRVTKTLLHNFTRPTESYFSPAQDNKTVAQYNLTILM
jgi:hypothetical protein